MWSRGTDNFEKMGPSIIETTKKIPLKELSDSVRNLACIRSLLKARSVMYTMYECSENWP